METATDPWANKDGDAEDGSGVAVPQDTPASNSDDDYGDGGYLGYAAQLPKSGLLSNYLVGTWVGLRNATDKSQKALDLAVSKIALSLNGTKSATGGGAVDVENPSDDPSREDGEYGIATQKAKSSDRSSACKSVVIAAVCFLAAYAFFVGFSTKDGGDQGSSSTLGGLWGSSSNECEDDPTFIDANNGKTCANWMANLGRVNLHVSRCNGGTGIFDKHGEELLLKHFCRESCGMCGDGLWRCGDRPCTAEEAAAKEHEEAEAAAIAASAAEKEEYAVEAAEEEMQQQQVVEGSYDELPFPGENEVEKDAAQGIDIVDYNKNDEPSGDEVEETVGEGLAHEPQMIEAESEEAQAAWTAQKEHEAAEAAAEQQQAAEEVAVEEMEFEQNVSVFGSGAGEENHVEPPVEAENVAQGSGSGVESDNWAAAVAQYEAGQEGGDP